MKISPKPEERWIADIKVAKIGGIQNRETFKKINEAKHGLFETMSIKLINL